LAVVVVTALVAVVVVTRMGMKHLHLFLRFLYLDLLLCNLHTVT
jgi:hypothetical protein